MAPRTRSSRSAGRDSSQLNERNISQNIQHEQHDEMEDDEQSDSREDRQSPYRSTAQDILKPLQDTADRVSRQVEEFAKCLDKFNSARDVDDQSLWEDAWRLLDKFNAITASQRDIKSPKFTRSNSRKSLLGTKAEMQKIQLEADLWLLTRNLLVCNSPQSINDAQINQKSKLEELHRYSSNTALWNAFLDSDTVSQEYECTLDWLQERAAQSSDPIEEALSKLLQKSERGDGVWSAGPMYTKSAIKQVKRLRAWPMPLDPSHGNLQDSHKRSVDDRPLVLQLDPDAQTREHAVLQTQDEYHEKAAWQTCWELLRRGQKVDQIRAWWAERKELWRSMIICACDSGTDQQPQSPWLRIINLASNPELLHRCKILCQNNSIEDKYQTAVYGILCGNLQAARSVSGTIDDDLFAIYNSLIIERYQHYLEAYKKRLTDSEATVYHALPASNDQIQHYLTYAQTSEAKKDDMSQAHKFIEMAVVGKDYKSFLLEMGRAAADVAHTSGGFAHLMAKESVTVHNESAIATAQDEDSVRIVAHLHLLLQALGLLKLSDDESELYLLENNIANYVGWLEHHGKFALIPLYASKLSKRRVMHLLGAVLINVTESKERDIQVRLMKQYHIDVPDVLYGIFSLANFELLERFRDSRFSFNPPKITEKSIDGHPNQTKIKSEFITGDLTKEEETAISSVEWFRYMDADNWGKAVWSVSSLYKILLSEGKFAALKALVRRASLSDISLAALSMNLRVADDTDNFSDSGDADMDGMDEEQAHPISPARKRKDAKSEHPLLRAGTSREALASKAVVWRQLEELVVALDALDRWQVLADHVDRNRTNKTQIHTMKRELREALEEVQASMAPLFEEDFLCRPLDEAERRILTKIRNHYIPECILSYNSVLYFAGHALSRQQLVDCMTLAQDIAENPTLTEAFVESGRMRELMSAFALDSQALLQGNEQGGSRAKKGKKEFGQDIWHITWQDQGQVDLDSLD